MVQPLARLFGRSPFGPLQQHMEKVRATLDQLRPFFEALLAGDRERARELRKAIMKLEHEADLVKNDIRDHLPISYFMPVDRRDLLSLLHQQDRLADLCEDLVIVATLRADLTLPEQFHAGFRLVLDKTEVACATAQEIIGQLDELLAASFGGPEAEKVIELIQRVGREEHEVDKAIYELARALYGAEQELGVVGLLLWQKILELVGDLANASEAIGDQIRLMISR
ncbi:MAG: TIGR00153 family protein [Acidobacteria bacterium]|nr:MAG: TIGR00153 family protein [Acidobacteriota bacterium]